MNVEGRILNFRENLHSTQRSVAMSHHDGKLPMEARFSGSMYDTGYGLDAYPEDFSRKSGSLAEKLRMAGIPPIPQGPYIAHRRAILRPYRTGPGRFLWPIGVAAARIPILCVGVFFLYVAAVYGVGLGLWHGIGLAFVFGVASFFVAEICRISMKHYGAHWDSVDALDPYAKHMKTMPCRLEHRVTKAVNIPGVRVYVLSFDKDPIIYAKCGSEIYYLGGWNTGNPDIDNA